ncbi:MAG TPA: hypothetical protein ENK19_07420 [Acidobacteria bacterium]|nr:hypothetical protein [Acidobacteriota bacterium]
MTIRIRRARYYHITVRDRPGEGCRALADLGDEGAKILAFTAVPTGPGTAVLRVFPEDEEALLRAAERSGTVLFDPEEAFIVRGDEHLTALTTIQRKFADAHINIYASNGIFDGHGGYSCVIYVRPEDVERAAVVLGVE